MQELYTRVTPYVGVWIETTNYLVLSSHCQSLLMWECGLKLCRLVHVRKVFLVTPYVGVWIETEVGVYRQDWTGVTPYVGVWIETARFGSLPNRTRSLLMWECGLKHCRRTHNGMDMLVTPYVGVWIETCNASSNCT